MDPLPLSADVTHGWFPVVDMLCYGHRRGDLLLLLLLLLGLRVVVVDVGVGAEGRRVVGVGLEYLNMVTCGIPQTLFLILAMVSSLAVAVF